MEKKKEANNSEKSNAEENSEERNNFEEALRAIFSLSPQQAKAIRESKPEQERTPEKPEGDN
jgi:hypothetical protein